MINVMAKLSYGVTFRIIISSHRGKARNNALQIKIIFICLHTLKKTNDLSFSMYEDRNIIELKKVILTGICLVR